MINRRNSFFQFTFRLKKYRDFSRRTRIAFFEQNYYRKRLSSRMGNRYVQQVFPATLKTMKKLVKTLKINKLSIWLKNLKLKEKLIIILKINELLARRQPQEIARKRGRSTKLVSVSSSLSVSSRSVRFSNFVKSHK